MFLKGDISYGSLHNKMSETAVGNASRNLYYQLNIKDYVSFSSLYSGSQKGKLCEGFAYFIMNTNIFLLKYLYI